MVVRFVDSDEIVDYHCLISFHYFYLSCVDNVSVFYACYMCCLCTWIWQFYVLILK